MNSSPLLTSLFWWCCAWVFWVYLGYPLCTWIAGKLLRRTVRQCAFQPRISLLIAAHNEADCIEATLRNKLESDYPADKLEILVISDSSTDGTDAIVEQLAATSRVPVRLLRQENHAGKTAALNMAVPHATGAVIVFADANSIYAPDALSRLVENFSDADVGYASGRMLYQTQTESGIAESCSTYMQYESFLREAETATGSIIGVDGGIDAVRADLYTNMAADDLPDFMLPLNVADKGYRVVYDARAKLYEDALDSTEAEFQMRVRVSLRALWTLWKKRNLLNPLRYGGLAIQLWSHKVLRYLCFIPTFALWPLSALLATQHWFYALAFVGQTAVYAMLLLNVAERKLGPAARIIALMRYITLLNLACAVALFKFLRGERQTVWKPRTG
jgi:cellulose synthase/poly-beta-1,6-N-acetylglucosamine synthase-like glycosyltransferase